MLYRLLVKACLGRHAVHKVDAAKTIETALDAWTTVWSKNCFSVL